MSMICGVEFKFSKLSELWEVFRFLGNNGTPYRFVVIDQAVCSKGRDIIIPKEFNSDYFLNMIRQSIVPERLVIHAYPIGESFQKIDNYDYFLMSKCELVLLMYDCWYMEIYCKDVLCNQMLLEVGKSLLGENATEKHSEYDKRVDFYV